MSGSFRRFKALLIKEFHQILRDPSSFLIALVLPTVLLIIYGFGVSLDYKHLKVGLVMEDTAPDAQSFATALANSPYFDVMVARDRFDIEYKVLQGSLKGFVVIPSYFSEFRQRQNNVAPLQVIADASDPNSATFLQNYVAAAYGNWLQIEQNESDWSGQPLVRVEPRFWFNEELDSRNFLLPGSLAITMTLIGTLLTSLVLSREWERGTMEALMATPVRMKELILAKIVAYFIVGMISFYLSTFFTVVFFGVPLRGSFLALTISTAVFLFTALGIGLLISTISKNQFVSSQIALNVGFLPAYMLSGFLFEISSMPIPIQLLSSAMPPRYFVSCLQTIFLAGDIWGYLLKNIGIMLVLALICYFWLIKRTVKRLDA